MSDLSNRVIAALEEQNRALAPAVRILMAEAWQEGYDIGCDRTVDAAANPYEY